MMGFRTLTAGTGCVVLAVAQLSEIDSGTERVHVHVREQTVEVSTAMYRVVTMGLGIGHA